MYQSIRPGKPWLDTEGKRIQAHGGSLFYEDDTFYWYGENKEKTNGKSDVWHMGVRMYESKDLYNWKDLGIVIPPEEDISSSLHPSSMADRPHIIRNRKTGKYVCWIKIMHSDGSQNMTILEADDLKGPYKKVREGCHPLGMNSGDFDLAVADDGKAYCYFERVHSETICCDLSDDYEGVSGYYSTHFPRKYPPYVREATAHFIRDHKHYLITSGTTGYLPNPSEAAVADSWHGPYKVLGDPHINDLSMTSFHSQISSVFRHPKKKDLYIALADRWLPQEMDLDYRIYAKVYEYLFTGRYSELESIVDKEILNRILFDGRRNTSIADYVWLPIGFKDDKIYIEWKDEWRIEDYE